MEHVTNFLGTFLPINADGKRQEFPEKSPPIDENGKGCDSLEKFLPIDEDRKAHDFLEKFVLVDEDGKGHDSVEKFLPIDEDEKRHDSPEKFVLIDADRKSTVNFLCRRCSEPFKLHSSFDDTDHGHFQDITARFCHMDLDEIYYNFTYTPKKKPVSGISGKATQLARFSEADDGFMLIGNLTNTTDYHKKTTDNQKIISCMSVILFDLMSGQSNVDHPLCEKCIDILLDQMDQQLKVSEDECRMYRVRLEDLEGRNEEENVEVLEAELEILVNNEEQLRTALFETEKEIKAMQVVFMGCQKEKELLQRKESEYFKEYCDLVRRRLLFEDDICSVKCQLLCSRAQSDKREKSDILAAFTIGYEGHVGIINGLRLGRLPSIPVEWSEINAALGLTVLLLQCLANKMDLTFERYRLVPCDDKPYVESLNDKSKKFPFCGFGSFTCWKNAKLDLAMVALLDCLQQFMEEVEACDSSFRFPHRVSRGKISDAENAKLYFVRFLISEEEWTKAMKFILLNLKYGQMVLNS